MQHNETRDGFNMQNTTHKASAVAKASLTRMQNFLESGDLKVNEIKVRLDKLPSIQTNLKVHRMN
jgi:GTP1/Obg family GTP-binding protein